MYNYETEPVPSVSCDRSRREREHDPHIWYPELYLNTPNAGMAECPGYPINKNNGSS